MSAEVLKPGDTIMSQDRCDHLTRLQTEALRRIGLKYVRGQAEHGGDLWRKGGLLDMAIDEAVDQLVYLLTLKEQMNQPPAGYPVVQNTTPGGRP